VEEYAGGLRVEVGAAQRGQVGSSRVDRAIPETALRMWSARSGLRTG
jgi:hypothetical protein